VRAGRLLPDEQDKDALLELFNRVGGKERSALVVVGLLGAKCSVELLTDTTKQVGIAFRDHSQSTKFATADRGLAGSRGEP
jgi:hypothetical protein